MNSVGEYLQETRMIAERISPEEIERLVDLLADVRADHGRLFVLGLGGSAANASHAAADFRMRAGLRAEAPESIAELTAWINDEGWDELFVNWLCARGLGSTDAVLVLSVGGGDVPPGTSRPLVTALCYAQALHAPIAGIVGDPGGVCAEVADVVVKIPTVYPGRKTEHCEAWQAIIWHLLCVRLAAL